jgi:hypothetical protein
MDSPGLKDALCDNFFLWCSMVFNIFDNIQTLSLNNFFRKCLRFAFSLSQSCHSLGSYLLAKQLSIWILTNIFLFLIGCLAPSDETSVREMQHLVGKVEEMKQQRAMLATQLRESTCQDDITRQLVTRTGESLDTIFSQEMQKHQRYVSINIKLSFHWVLNIKLVF